MMGDPPSSPLFPAPPFSRSVPAPPRAKVREVAAKLAARRHLIPLVEAYRRRKRELELLDFGDQVALAAQLRSEEHTSELPSRQYLVCRLLLEKKKKTQNNQL